MGTEARQIIVIIQVVYVAETERHRALQTGERLGDLALKGLGAGEIVVRVGIMRNEGDRRPAVLLRSGVITPVEEGRDLGP